MAQWVMAVVVKPDDLGLIPGSHMVEGESQSGKLSSAFQCMVPNSVRYMIVTGSNGRSVCLCVYSCTHSI